MNLEWNRKLSLCVLKTLRYTILQKQPDINIDELSRLYTHICFFDSNAAVNSAHKNEYNQLLAIGCKENCRIETDNIDFNMLNTFISIPNEWKFGYLTYDVKNSIENLYSKNEDHLKFPVVEFFIPTFVFEILENEIVLHFNDQTTTDKEAEAIYKLAFADTHPKNEQSVFSEIKNRISKEAYLNAVTKLKEHIQQGDIYEINFCHEFYAENSQLNTYELFLKLNAISEAPFASFCKFNDHYVLSSSPERFIKKTENHLLSQPIKGTAKRSDDSVQDELLKQELKNSKKEQNENVMIVDLVRNDLSKIAAKGSVRVDELFGVYSYKQVHHLVSSISCDVKPNTSFVDIVKAMFPMGSMTGAPKIRAMQLIEETETTKRGLYSGSIGYIKPNGDVDFNVVIRSILYNSKTKYASIMVGSAITAQAHPEKEYAECMLKAKAMMDVLTH